MVADIILFVLATVILSPSTPAQPRASYAQLRLQVKRHYSYFSHGRYDLMWEKSSKAFKQSNDDNKEKYVTDLQKYGFGQVKARILRTHIFGAKAQVTVLVRVWSNHEKKWVRDVITEKWLFENGDWVFDGQSPSGL
jgi:hypothetical protein